jgi:flagellar basal-body rod protein FlgG
MLGQGDLQQTNRPLDMAISGEGYFMVRKPDNELAYSRDGSFKVDRNSTIVNSQGYPLEPGFQVPDNTLEMIVSAEGVVSVLLEGQTEHTPIGQIELARFINPAGLKAVGDNLFNATPASGQAIFETPGTNNTGVILQNQLESSNVDVVEEMVNMITAQRAYELNSKSVRTAESILETAVNLKR